MSGSPNDPFFPPGVPAPPGTGNEQLGPGSSSPFVHQNKPAYPIKASESYASSFFGFLDPFFGTAGQFMENVAEKRRMLALPFPGTAEHLQREVKSESNCKAATKYSSIELLITSVFFPRRHAFNKLLL